MLHPNSQQHTRSLLPNSLECICHCSHTDLVRSKLEKTPTISGNFRRMLYDCASFHKHCNYNINNSPQHYHQNRQLIYVKQLEHSSRLSPMPYIISYYLKIKYIFTGRVVHFTQFADEDTFTDAGEPPRVVARFTPPVVLTGGRVAYVCTTH